jgi:hypothetical protein
VGGKAEFHASFDHPAEVMEDIHIVIRGMHILEVFQFLLFDHIEQMHEDILLVFKILIETSFGNAAFLTIRFVDAFSKPYSANSSTRRS